MPNSNQVTKEEFQQLVEKVDEMAKSQKALLDAWTTATGVVKFVKVLSTLVVAIGTIWFFITHGFRPPAG